MQRPSSLLSGYLQLTYVVVSISLSVFLFTSPESAIRSLNMLYKSHGPELVASRSARFGCIQKQINIRFHIMVTWFVVPYL